MTSARITFKLTSISLISVFVLSACSQLQGLLPSQGSKQAMTETVVSISPTAKSTVLPTIQPSATPMPGLPVEKLHGRKVIFWHPWTGPREKLIKQMALEFNLSNSYQIQVEPHSLGGIPELLDGLVANPSEYPDLVVLSPELISSANDLPKPFIDLKEYDQQPDIQFQLAEPDDFQNGLLDAVSSDGHMYGIPASVDTSMLVYNKSWAMQLGFSNTPTTIEEMNEQACEAARFNNRQSNLSLHGTGGWLIDDRVKTIMAWLQAYGLSGFYSETNQEIFTRPEIENAFIALKQMAVDNCSWLGKNPIAVDYFTNRNALFVSADLPELKSIQASLKKANSKDVWEVLPYPGSAGTWMPEALYYAIPAGQDAQQLAAWVFVQWISETKQETRLAVGDGYLPVRKASWQSLESQNMLAPQTLMWMKQASDSVVPPYQSEWGVGKAVLQDGYRQLFSTNLVPADIPDLLTMMDNMLSDLESQN